MDPFEEIFQRHSPAVRRFALFLTGDPVRADDLVAEVFVRAWQARDRIRQPTVRAYLLTIARNLYRDQLRSPAPRAVELDGEMADSQPSALARLECRGQLQDMRGRLKRVARGDRRALLLFVVKERSYADIADALGISVGAVKSRIARARSALRTPVPAADRATEMKP
jgi:RNA polymerase sigma-70 factor (ECF subfamily)